VKGISVLALVFISTWSFLTPAGANDGTRVTSGTLTFASQQGQIDAGGQADFSMQAFVDSSSGIFDFEDTCNAGPLCQPGTQVSLGARWNGIDLRGTATLRGRHYILGGEGDGHALGDAKFDGTVTMPDFTSSGIAQVSAPFSFSGELTPDGGSADPLTGSGIATIDLKESPDGTSWTMTSATYEFRK
jgi:hypothetical protein